MCKVKQPATLVEKATLNCFCIFAKIRQIWMDPLPNSVFCSSDLYMSNSAICTVLNTEAIWKNLKSDQYLPHYSFFCQCCLSYSEIYTLSYEFWNNLLYIYKKSCWECDRNWLNLCPSVCWDLTSLLCEVFPFIIRKYFPIYLDL